MPSRPPITPAQDLDRVQCMADRMNAAFRNSDVAEADEMAVELVHVQAAGEHPAARKAASEALAGVGLHTDVDIVAKIVRPVWEQALQSADDAALDNAVQTIAVWEDYGVLEGSSLPSVKEIATSSTLPLAAKRAAFEVLKSRREMEMEELRDMACCDAQTTTQPGKTWIHIEQSVPIETARKILDLLDADWRASVEGRDPPSAA